MNQIEEIIQRYEAKHGKEFGKLARFGTEATQITAMVLNTVHMWRMPKEAIDRLHAVFTNAMGNLTQAYEIELDISDEAKRDFEPMMMEVAETIRQGIERAMEKARQLATSPRGTMQ